MKNTFSKTILYAFFASLLVILPASFVLAGQIPTISTLPASSVTQNSATLNGTFSSNGDATTIWFEYGTTTAMGKNTPAQSKGPSESGSFSATITGLQAGQTYYYRAVGLNKNGFGFGTAPNNVQVIAMPQGSAPTVSTDTQTNVTTSSATLNGTFNGNGLSTSTQFEYWENTDPGTISKTPLTAMSALSATLSAQWRSTATPPHKEQCVHLLRFQILSPTNVTTVSTMTAMGSSTTLPIPAVLELLITQNLQTQPCTSSAMIISTMMPMAL